MKIQVVEMQELVKKCIIDTDKLNFKDFISNFATHHGENFDDIENWEEFIEQVVGGNLDWELNDYVMNTGNFNVEESWHNEKQEINIL